MKVLVLAGGYDQIALINELKERKCEVILADYFENPPAKKYADKHFQVSTLDEEAIFNLAKSENVDLITTACTDQALLTVAKVSEKLDLPCYISYEKALNVTNKQFMKKKFVDNKISTARYYLVKSTDELDYIGKNMNFPLVVKPCDCNSSKGVLKVRNNQELNIAVKNALELSRTSTAIVEIFQKGIEISVDVWVDKEGAKVLSASTTNKNSLSKDTFTIYQSKYPVTISQKAWDEINQIANKIAEGFELKNCPMLIQLIVDEDQAFVIEFSARMGGGTKYQLIQEMSGINIMQKYVNRVLGDVDQIINPEFSKDYIELNYVYARNGIFKKLYHFEEAKKLGLITDYFLYKESGSVIEKATTSSDRIVGFLIKGTSEDDLKKKRKVALEYVDILDDQDKSMMLKDIYND